MQENKVGMIA